MRGLLRPLLATALVASSAVVISVAAPVASPPVVEAAVANPEIQDSCGTDVTLVLDASGSVHSSRAEGKVRDAASAFLEALADTGSTARLLQFATFTGELAARTEVTGASLDPGGTFSTGLRGYYNPQPPRPPGVRRTSIQYTNWDGSLRTTRSDTTELVVYITDGDPTAYDRDGGSTPGDPFDDRLDARVTGSHASQEALDRAIVEADALKSSGARILAVGVGSALDSSSSRNRLEQISGPQVVRDSDIGSIDSINDIDVALVNDFDQLARFLRSVVSELCAPSLSIRKLAQSPDSAAYESTPGWDITATPAVAGGTYRWVLPDTDAAQSVDCGNPADPNDQGSRTCRTDAQGLVQFQWEPNPKDATSTARISEAVEPGYTPGRPGAADYRCQIKDIDGNVTVDQDELDGNGFDITLRSQDIVTCVLYNSFDYQPDIEITKVDDPQQIRGDVSPGSDSTSTFQVTNPGNAALHDVSVIDDRCSPVAYQSGDADNDQLLDTTETWTFTCTRELSASPGDPVQEITNRALVQAKDPVGTVVTDITTADVAVYAPAISIEKTPSVTQVPLNSTTPVTYTYVVTNTGSMPLTNVGVVDDPSVDPQSFANSGCTPVATVDPTTLDPGATATFTCTTSLNPTVADQRFVNAARVTGTPSFPTPPFTPVPGPTVTTGPVGPAVTAVDTAVVTTTNIVEGLELAKVALDPNTDDVVSVVFPGTEVLYRYTVANTGNVDLGRPAGDPTDRDGWVVDNIGPSGICSPVTYVSGDTNNDLLLSAAVNGTPAETWTYECTAAVTGAVTPVKNTAVIVAETQTPTPDRLVRTATATVSVVAPSMELVKTAVRPVVLDPTASPDDGPDTPSPRPAAYTYELTNTGPVPIANVSLDDTMPQRPGDCSPIQGPTGDAGTAGVLDVGETWSYTCEIAAVNPLAKGDDDSGGDPGPGAPATVTDTATATGTAIILKPSGQPLTVPVGPVTDTAVVNVVSPGIGLQKTPCVDDGGSLVCDPDPDDADDLLVRPGTDVTYRYEVSNTGDSRVFPVVGLDDKCAPLAYEAGDTNTDGFIDVGETWEYRCTTPVDFPSPVTNEAGVLVVGPLGNLYSATDTARVRVFEPAIDLVKTVSDNFVPVGTTVTYTFEVTNAATSGTDGLPADLVLDQIDLVDVSDPENPTCASPSYVDGDTNDNSLLDVDPLETWTYTCTGLIDERTVDVAGVVGIDVAGGPVFDFDFQVVTPYNAALTVDKTATPDRLDAPGGSVTYTYEVGNTGDIPLANVASTIADDTCAPVTYVSGDVDGNGLLTSGDDIFETGIAETWVFTCTTDVTVDTTNTVTLTGTPVDPSTDPPTPLGPAVPGTDTATVVVQNRSLAVTKTSDASTAVQAGDVIEYEITVTNDGEAPWGAARLASITDDLTDVIDDATYNGDAVATSANADDGTVAYSVPDLIWEGPLDPGQTATVRYSVTVVDPAGSSGDGTLANAVTGPPESSCVVGDEVGCTTSVPVTGLSIAKSSDAGDRVVPGDTITYSVVVTNAGAADYTAADPAVVGDDLSAVLDDASFVAGSAAVSPDQGTVGLSGTTLTWTGPLAAGASVTVSYQVTVNDPVTGDGILTNRVTGPPESNCTPASQDPACTTTEPVEELRIVKTAAPVAVAPGGIVTYTITVENTGGYAYTLADPATFTDDLAADELLTYATWLGNETATIGAVDYTAPDVSWSGPLLPGDTATITFQVQVRPDNDVDGNDLVNTVVGPPESNCDTGSNDPDCTVTVPILERGVTIVKSSTPATAYPGDVVAYTLTISNTGTTEETGVIVSDDLSDVLDDATTDGQPAASAGTAEIITDTLTWTGDLAVGETVTVTYSVTVDDPPAGDGTLLNTVTGPPESNCPTGSPASECITTTPIHQLDITKSSSGPSPVLPGSRVTYTVVIDNTGSADYTANNPAVVIDDLSDVLDDASIDASSGTVTPAQGSAGLLGDALVWVGSIAAGSQVTIEFDVVVDDPAGGNHSLVNTIGSPPESNCERGSNDPDCATTDPVASIAIAKTSDATDTVAAGDVITYQLSVTNTGQVQYAPADIVDDLSGVLDDASYNPADESASQGIAVFADVAETLTWSVGELAPGATATLTYSVTVLDPNEPPYAGDGQITNAVTGSPESNCDTGTEPGCTTTTPIRALDIVKTSSASGPALPGDRIDYTVVVTSTGAVDYPAAVPGAASFTDDLGDVLDDATLVPGSVVATGGIASIGGSTLTWNGPLPAGSSTTIEYSVTVNDPVSGDGDVTNAVTGPPESNCDTGTETGCRTTTPIIDLTIIKSALPSAVAPGGIVTYTIEIENTGGFVYSDAAGVATVTDSLADESVLDLATYVANSENATVGSAFFDGSVLRWTGPDAAWGPGATATVTFQVRVNTTPDVDGQTLTNTVVGPPESNCAPPDPTDPDCTVDVPVLERGLTIAKSSTPATAFPGDVVSYTLTISNTGATAENGVTATDDLTDVLDDAASNGAPSASAGTAGIADNLLTWTGDLAVGEAVTVTYDVTVDDPGAGDGILTNVVTGPPESNCPTSAPTPADECTTTTPLHELSVVKTATPSAPAAAEPGDTVTYSLAVTNTGAADYTAATPAVVTDDLAGLLDDAAVDPTSLTVTPTAGSVALVGTMLTWTGPLAIGDTVTVEFDAVIDDPITADGSVVNTIVGPPESNCVVGSNDPDCTTNTPVRALDITKVASPIGPVTPGELVTYTITVTNPGTIDYTSGEPAVLTDDLSDVLDDATISSQSATVGTLSFSGTDAVWTGPLPAGASATITIGVTVNDPVSGDGVLANTVTGPPESNCDTGIETGCTTTTPVQELLITKVAQPTAVAPDGTVTYTVTVENTGGYVYTPVDPATFTDDLTPVLATATFVTGSASASAGTATYAAPILSWSGPLAPGATATVTFDVRILDVASVPAFDTPVANIVVGPPASNCGTGSADPGCTATITVLQPGLTIVKTSTPINADPGDTVTYTLLVTNTGETPEYGVSVVDELTDVLDDAEWNVGSENAVASSASTTSLTFAEPTLTWTGNIAIGGQVEITYSVTVDARDALAPGAELDNVVTGPPESNCAGEIEPGCSTTTPIHQLQVAKTATPASGSPLRPGDRVTYQIEISNVGSADYTAGRPAVVTEDLSSLFDDAALDPTTISVTPSIGAVDLVGDVGSWSGPLSAGQTVTVTFDVIVDDPPSGDAQLLNRIVGPPESNCDSGSNDPACSTTHPIEALQIVKSSDAGASVVPGQIVRYEITATNVGQVAIDPTVVTDDLTAVLDDATYRNDAAAVSDNADDGVVDDTTPTLTWTGPLDPGESVVIDYSVRVSDPNAAGYTGDGVLTNAVAGPPESNCDLGDEPGCTTTVPIRALSIAKTSDAGPDVVAGSSVTYEVVVTNTGQVDYTVGFPAAFVDDLSGVVDDATYNDDDTIAPAGEGITAYDDATSKLTWTGPLAVGASVTITYSVDIGDPNDSAYNGDGIVENVVVGPPESICGPQRVACRTEVPVRALRIAKSASPTFVQPGDQVAYTITIENTGAVDYTIAAPASIVDDLSDVLDDATYDANAGTTPADVGTLGVDTVAETLSWDGPLAAGESLDITYSVTVDDPVVGDGQLDNVVTGPPESNCEPRSTDPACTATAVTRAFSIEKTVDVGVAEPGDVVTYTIVVTNESSEPFPAGAPATFTDDLSGVVDDATYNGDVTATTGDATFDASAETLSWSGPLPVGGDATITYSVTVDEVPAGDATLENMVTGPPGSNCETTADPACSTRTTTRWIRIEKVTDFDVVEPGDVIGYAITVTNQGTAPYTAGSPAEVADDLSGALDDATWNDDASATVGTVSYAAPVLAWTAALGAGQTATINYSLTVDDPPSGDMSIDNSVIGLVIGNCAVDDGLAPLGDECITKTEVVPPTPPTTTPTTTTPTTVPPTTQPTPSIPPTGNNPAPIGRIAVLLLIAGGAFLVVARSRFRPS